MRGDFSRLTWDRSKHYTAVLMQQGRLQMDADWNEQIAVIMHRLETEVADYVGHSGVPARAPDGFRVQVPTDKSGAGTIVVGAGRMYVEGRLIENESAVPVDLAGLLADDAVPDGRRFVAYLDTWQRLVTFAEDPDIREVALGGPDTAARVQNAWRVRIAAAGDGATPATVPPSWQPARTPISTGTLNARVSADLPSLENQLYRVEVYSATAENVTFTWSRDNGSIEARVTDVQPATRTLSIEGGGRDADTAVAERQWVELLTEAEDQAGTRGAVAQIDQATGDQIVVTAVSWPWTGDQAPAIAVLRRWDDPAGLVTAPLVTPGDDDAGWVPLENGIEVRFETAADGGNQYVPGDYWLIPARHDTASIEWPGASGRPVAQPARGVRHTYAALALLDRDPAGVWSVVDGGDLRPLVSPLDDGFVSKGAAGDTMRGPLSVQPHLRATTAGEELVAVRIAPAFDDAGQPGVAHTALKVTGGDIVLGTSNEPVTATANGLLTVLGTVSATELKAAVGLSVEGIVTVAGLEGESAAPAETALRIGRDNGALEWSNGLSPHAGFLRFGDNSGWKFHIGRAREAVGAAHNTGATGALLTVTDNGRIGVGITSPSAQLHVVASGSGAALAVSGQLSMAAMRNYLLSPATPNGTVVVGYGAGTNLGREGVYVFWKNASGDRFGAILTPDPDVTQSVRQSGSS
jgi:uncharacterized protein DUF6519